MTFNDAGLALLKEFEGCSLTAYEDQGGLLTIGYGSTHGVTKDMTINADEALIRLMNDIALTESAVKKAVTYALTDNQYSAYVCFAFNVRGWADCPLTKHLALGDLEGARAHWLLYDKVAGVHSVGLARRRKAELDLFNT